MSTSMKASSREEIDQALEKLQGAKDRWTGVTAEERETLLNRCMQDLKSAAEDWVTAACKGKQVSKGGHEEGEEWVGSFMPVMRNLRLLSHAMKHGGQPPLPGKHQHKNGQWIAKVFPMDLKEKLMFSGFEAEVWIEAGKEPTQGQVYRKKNTDGAKGKLALVLGAGNQGSIGPMDCLHKLFVEDEVCVLKMNPVNDYLGPYVERAFAALIKENFMAVVYGGVEEGKYLCAHDNVDSIHITGSARTHDAIVWGPGGDKTGSPKNTRPISSELGCVTPVIVVPGNWTDGQLDYQARQIASMVTHNAGFNCNAGKLVVVQDGWDRKEKLLKSVEKHLKGRPPRKAYYPGAKEQHAEFVSRNSNSVLCGEAGEGELPWALFPKIPPVQGEHFLTNEGFCGILGVTALPDGDNFLERAVSFCNEQVWGSLSAHIIIDPKTAKRQKTALDKALETLRYGSIAVNCWSGVNYGLCTTTWGAHPGHSLEDIQSGVGTVHNTFLLDHPQKSIVKAPFVIKPTPPWFHDNKNLLGIGRKLVAFEHKPSWGKFFGVVFQSIKG